MQSHCKACMHGFSLSSFLTFGLIPPTQALANQVCEKVESKVRTTYNEVADELVSEFGNVEGTGQHLPLWHATVICTGPTYM